MKIILNQAEVKEAIDSHIKTKFGTDVTNTVPNIIFRDSYEVTVREAEVDYEEKNEEA